MGRRRFLHLLASGAAGALCGPASALDRISSIPTLYYMDGYHGGVRGHMPPGSWRDILSALREFPQWKISLDIEPESWEVLKRTDPEAFTELAALLRVTGPQARVEMVAGTFAQPYGWAIHGESNIRQMQRGLDVIHAHFHGLAVSTYAVQEPCWASCLPQILHSLAFTGASLKDASTAWGGYAAGKDAELVRWIGPDGTPIPAVPRYAIERLQKVYETESIDATAEFSQRCVDHGILHPAGMCFQDLGWPAKPRVSGSYIQFMTWREYIHEVAKVSADWRFGIEDILVTLPWGDPTLRIVAQQVRSAEVKLVYAEKLASLAFLKEGAPWPGDALREAWDELMLSQAHDAWITATTRSGRQAWSFQVAAHTLAAEETADDVASSAAATLAATARVPVQATLGTQAFRIFNTLAHTRRDLAQISLSADPGTAGFRVRDQHGAEVQAQTSVTRKYLPQASLHSLSERHEIEPGRTEHAENDGITHAVISFRADVPSIGYSTYDVTPLPQAPPMPSSSVTAKADAEGVVVLENDLYRIALDPRKGGAITSLFVKQPGKEFCDPSSEFHFNEYRGYFIAQQSWESSTHSPATISIQEAGPIRAAVEVEGTVGNARFQTRMELVEGQRRIDLHTRFFFDQDTWIGDPFEVPPDQRRVEPRRSQNDGRWKLQAMFPTSLPGGSIYKNAAFDVCRSRNDDTFFQSWRDIKHNIVVDWVDLLDADERFGLAVFSDHTTAYSHGPQHPLSLVLGWAWDGGFWWGKSVLRGQHAMAYSIVPHEGRWDRALLAREYSAFVEPLYAAPVGGSDDRPSKQSSLLQTGSAGLEVSALLIADRRALIRFYNAEAAQENHVITFTERPSRVERVALDGRLLEVLPQTMNGSQVHVRIPRFGLEVLRCSWRNVQEPRSMAGMARL